ncbi:MAG: hypothetical protein EBZ87_05170, partial [Microbacteriaceae bacterium]|nr:hypothetical protein [Microbacteriaceae bacterium]
TNPNRLRRVDRYISSQPALRMTSDPIVVDLGFGATPTTPIEMLERLSKTQPNVVVVGIEIDRERVNRALPFQAPSLLFGLGGFEVPLPSPLKTNAATSDWCETSRIEEVWSHAKRLADQIREASVLLLLRPLVVDLLCATGMSEDEARAELPEV